MCLLLQRSPVSIVYIVCVTDVVTPAVMCVSCNCVFSVQPCLRECRAMLENFQLDAIGRCGVGLTMRQHWLFRVPLETWTMFSLDLDYLRLFHLVLTTVNTDELILFSSLSGSKQRPLRYLYICSVIIYRRLAIIFEDVKLQRAEVI